MHKVAMKWKSHITQKLITLALLRALFFMPGESKAEAGTRLDVGIFYSSLMPYGEWVHAQFGRAWRPAHVDHGWRPYMYGRWAWTDCGWYWISEEPYGWATYHYGRWYYDDFYGWIWLPGETWAPAWVEWRYSDDYIGWAPLSPFAEFSVDIGVHYSGRWITPMHYWNFVPSGHFASTRAVDYVQPIERTRRIFGSTRGTPSIQTEGNVIMNRGVDVNFVERRGNVRVNRVDIVTSEREPHERLVRESSGEHIEVYRPNLEHRSPGGTVAPQQRAPRPPEPPIQRRGAPGLQRQNVAPRMERRTNPQLYLRSPRGTRPPNEQRQQRPPANPRKPVPNDRPRDGRQ